MLMTRAPGLYLTYRHFSSRPQIWSEETGTEKSMVVVP
jgi:hypothetical protein